jgi:uncharacterized protein YjgD (DUF1641 family)
MPAELAPDVMNADVGDGHQRDPLDGIATRLDEVAQRLDDVVTRLDAAAAARRPWRELGGELSALAGPATTSLTSLMADAEERGYVTFARGSAGIVDRVVTSFDRDDLAALGDNVVLILNTIREMTQPEVMTMLRRTAVTIRADEDRSAGTPPSTWALLRQLRDPQVRRGLDHALNLLRAIGADAESARAKG